MIIIVIHNLNNNYKMSETLKLTEEQRKQSANPLNSIMVI